MECRNSINEYTEVADTNIFILHSTRDTTKGDTTPIWDITLVGGLAQNSNSFLLFAFSELKTAGVGSQKLIIAPK